mmetsp:Transcript_37971/g.108434  ORF Transcript_37971/g.108434 Transcript_37971/m.108434 type:complete len:166 (+) Transcript_37971:997-1494(+)
MCGSNTIIEVATAEEPILRRCFFIAGDSQSVPIDKTYANLQRLPARRARIDVVRWTAERLPLRSDVLDVIVTDMPFGKRLSCADQLRTVYPRCLKEFHRSLSVEGRAVLLTGAAYRLIRREIDRQGQLGAEATHPWVCVRDSAISMGGLHPVVFALNKKAREVRR